MLPLFKVFMSETASSAVAETLNSGFITQGKKVEELETALVKWFNYPYILTLSSATAGLTLALRLLNLPIGSEVLCTPLTCMATTCAVLENRLKIKWVDVDPDTCNMDLDCLKKAITPNTKAIVFVHWAGSPIDLDRLKKVAGDIPIVEDCAHAFGATYHGLHLGKHGNLAVYSLQAIKHFTTGDGGLIFCRNKEEYERAKLLRWFGISREKPPGVDFRMEDDIKEWGYKFHMNDINATIGLANLPHVEGLVEKHQRNAEIYNRALSNLLGVTLLDETYNSKSAYWLYSLKVQGKDSFMKFMKQKGVTVSQVHNRNDIHSCVGEFKTDLPQMDALEKELVSIPVGWWLEEKDILYIVDCIKQWCNVLKDFGLEETKNIIIRPLQRTDKEGYLTLLEQLNGYVCDRDKFDVTFSALALTHAVIYVATVQDGTETILVSTGKVFIEPKFSNNVAHIEDVVTHGDYRGLGLGSKILLRILDHVRALNPKPYKVVLNCSEENEEFYYKRGFSRKGSEIEIKL